MSWTLVATAFVGVLGWRETRLLGAQLDDRELREGAPVVGGLAAGLACAVGVVLTPDVGWYDGGAQAIRLSAGSMVSLLGLEGLLVDQGRLSNEWLLLPGPLAQHAREKI